MVQLKLVNRGTDAELIIIGGLDTASAGQVEKIAGDLVAKYDNLIFNLSELDYIASSGLRILRNTHVALNKKGGDLTIKSPKPAVTEVFEMTGFASFLHIV
ncbi:MAG: STAS domain-containing protein [Clostridia bacterium]|nr:STAS domain-containing protein [Clostridia bacterium]